MSSLVERLTSFFSKAVDNRPETDRFGKDCEQAAARFLKRSGFVLIEKNYRDYFGEIDLIMVEKRTLVFVEVKARRSESGGAGFEAVDIPKQRKIAKTAKRYLQKNDLLENASRFDVISILWPKDQRKPKIDHYRDAFQPAEAGQLF